jgi:hypothetical protein
VIHFIIYRESYLSAVTYRFIFYDMILFTCVIII